MAGLSRVQSLAEECISQIPSHFIQPPENRPAIHPPIQSSLNFPCIDLFGLDSGNRGFVREAIGQACAEWGAFHVTNHGVPLQLLDRFRTLGLSFFQDCPLHERLKYACVPNFAASEGYGSRMLVNDGAVLDWRDYFDHHTLPLSRRDPSRWPTFPPSYREVVTQYSDEMFVLAQKLLALISESLGLASSRIQDAVGDFYQNITVSYYPPCPQPELTLGLQSHSDIGCITLLIQDDVGGLQVFKDPEWVTVDPVPHAILVILCDQTEIITNGKYRSAVHRVITNSTKARLSVSTFHDPAKTATMRPAPELLTASSPARYNEVKYGDYVASWYTKGPQGKRNIDALLLTDS